MSTLENEIEALRSALADLAERVRAESVADEFLSVETNWRIGDHFTLHGDVHRIDNIDSDGDWLCGRVEAPARYWKGAERLYTRAEVAAIVAKAAGK